MNIQQLIREDEVHRDVYVSEDVFALEMDRIFGSAWIYVGHDSQIPNPGDYWTTRIGLESVVMARGKRDEINVFTTGALTRARALRLMVAGIPRGCSGALITPGPLIWTAR